MKNVLVPVVMLVGFNVNYAQQTESARDSLKQAEITEVELFGVAKQQPVKLETITRLPSEDTRSDSKYLRSLK